MAGISPRSLVQGVSRIIHSTKVRAKTLFSGVDPAVCIAFWIFGLINNVLYVIILSSALDLVGPSLPKSMVLLFDVAPSFLTKLLLPYVIHQIPYPIRILILCALSFTGMQFVAHAPSLGWRMFGVVLASIASGMGELSFLAMTHYYGPFALASWGSGTGAAGLVGAGCYSIVTTWWGWSVRGALAGFSFLPFVMVGGFWGVLPREALKYWGIAEGEGVGVAGEREREGVAGPSGVRRGSPDRVDAAGHETEGLLGRGGDGDDREAEVVVGGAGSHHHNPHHQDHHRDRTGHHHGAAREFPAHPAHGKATKGEFLPSLIQNLRRAQALFFPYMLPLLLVYIAEYTINQGVSPTLLFPIDETPFKNYRDFYPTYNTLYQIGVFISRSSHLIVRVQSLYIPSLLQCLNLAFLLVHALYPFIPNVYLVWLVVFWEGLLGGAVYVNTFARISEEVKVEEREFSLAAVTVADSGGICVAGLVGLWLEGWICRWQVADGRPWCGMS